MGGQSGIEREMTRPAHDSKSRTYQLYAYFGSGLRQRSWSNNGKSKGAERPMRGGGGENRVISPVYRIAGWGWGEGGWTRS